MNDIKRYTAYAAQWTLNVLAWCEISFFLHTKLKICMVLSHMHYKTLNWET